MKQFGQHIFSLKKYEKVIYDVERDEGNGGWKNVIKKCSVPLNDTNITFLRAIHSWRDHIARKEDESTRFVIPNHMLINLARFMPTNEKDVTAGCSPAPSLVRLFAKELATIIEQAVKCSKLLAVVSPLQSSIQKNEKHVSLNSKDIIF
jgi:exosome complex exonuclease RRP6